jgi:DNA replication protein DnaC
MAPPTPAAETARQIRYLAAALKAPRITEAAVRLADQARDAGWTHEDYLAAVLDREVSARSASGANLRIRAAGFPAVKTVSEFDFGLQPAARAKLAPLTSGAYLTEARNIVLLGPPGTGKTHLAIGLGLAAAQHGQRVLFATATEWVTRLQDVHRAGRLPAELARLRRYGLIIIDLCRHRDYAEDSANIAGPRPWRRAGPRHSPVLCRAGLGPEIYPGVLVTGCRGTRGSCRWGGSGPAWL